MRMSKDLPPRYNPQDVEDRIYKMWEMSGSFNPDKFKVQSSKFKVFSIVLPPPNVTGRLHMGHAAMLAVEDILARYHRMKGDRTLWLPGTDHAAIATQSRVEDDLYEKEHKTRHDLGREEFLGRVERFAKESHDTIVTQIKKMGASLDWSREAYTLDEERSLAVRTAFKRMYDMGLIYKGERIVNWDPKMQTTISDDEIERVEEKATFYYLQYGPFVIATARPETKFGDKYVAMHPDDKRYREYKHGQKIELEWINGPVIATVIKDKAVDMTFGTGVMTITPWHDAVDFEIAERHGLEKEQVIDLDGKLLPIAGEFAGMPIAKARPLIAEKLKAKGLVVKVEENYVHNVATNSRGGGMVEPQIMMQWFVAVNKPFTLKHSRIKGIRSGTKITFKELMRRAVRSGQIEIIPKRSEKIYFHWIENLRDWCISRQIWFGHRIPVWYCKKSKIKNQKSNIQISSLTHTRETAISPECDEPIVSIEGVKQCPHCGDDVEQDPDTLDTWFSSGLWTFSVFGWPKETKDLKLYHPTSVLETGYDILFFWVARMILMTGCLLGDIPFRNVYLHGLVRDAEGRKMSKSLGNIIDPLELIEKYGADAVRLSLIIGAAPGSDIKLSEERVKGYRNFTTKIWNATRFVLMHVATPPERSKVRYGRQEKAMLAKLKKLCADTTKDLERFRLHHAAESLYHFFWHYYADKVIEAMKPRLAPGGEMIDFGNQSIGQSTEKETAKALLLEFHTTLLKLLHPFVPFVTEELWSTMNSIYRNVRPERGRGTEGIEMSSLLMVEKWPDVSLKSKVKS